MKIEIPKKYENVEINSENWFIAKSSTDLIKVQLPKPKKIWWVDGYIVYDTYFEVTLIDGKQKR